MLGRILKLRHKWKTGCYDSETLSRIASQAYWRETPYDDPEERE
jgi:hypothetical protein